MYIQKKQMYKGDIEKIIPIFLRYMYANAFQKYIHAYYIEKNRMKN